MPERGDRIWPQIKLWIRGEHERKSCISLNGYYVIGHDRVSSPVHCCRRCRLARAFLSEKHDDLPVQNNRAAVKNQESPLVKYHGQGWSQDQGAKCSLIDPWSRRDSNVATSHNSKSRDPFPTRATPTRSGFPDRMRNRRTPVGVSLGRRLAQAGARKAVGGCKPDVLRDLFELAVDGHLRLAVHVPWRFE